MTDRVSLIAIVVLTALVTACGSDTPTAPTPPPPPPLADVHFIGALRADYCEFPYTCSIAAEQRRDLVFSGMLINGGPDCAANIRGVTYLFDAKKAEIGIQQWTIENRIRPAEQVIYQGCCFLSSVWAATVTYRTDVFFDAVRC